MCNSTDEIHSPSPRPVPPLLRRLLHSPHRRAFSREDASFVERDTHPDEAHPPLSKTITAPTADVTCRTPFRASDDLSTGYAQWGPEKNNNRYIDICGRPQIRPGIGRVDVCYCSRLAARPRIHQSYPQSRPHLVGGCFRRAIPRIGVRERLYGTGFA